MAEIGTYQVLFQVSVTEPGQLILTLNGEDLAAVISAYGDQFGHIHIADAPGRHEPGTGKIDYCQVLQCLEKIGYSGLVGFELFPKTTSAAAAEAIMKL